MNAVTLVLQEMVNVALKPENVAHSVLGTSFLHGGPRLRCVVTGFIERGPAARSTGAELLGD